MRALISIFFLPFWMFFIAAIGIAGLTEVVVDAELKTNAEKAIAREQPMPTVIDLSEFDKKTDRGLVGEVHIRGWVNSEYNKHLIKTKNGSTRSERYLMVMFGEGDTGTSKQAKAALIMTKTEREAFLENLVNYATGFGANGPELQFNGKARSRETQSDQAKDAMREDGLTLSPDFFFIEPYWEGRQVAFAAKPERAGELRQTGYLIAAFFALIGLVKWGMRAARKPKRNLYQDDFHDSPIISGSKPRAKAQPIVAAVSQPSQVFTSDSPLGRLNAKSTMQEAQEHAPEMSLNAGRPKASKKAFKKAGAGMPDIPKPIQLGIAVVVVFWILPSGALPLLFPLFFLAGGWYLFFKLTKTVGTGVGSLFGLMGGNPKARASGQSARSDGFSRLH